MKYSLTKWYGFPMGPRDSCFEMQIVTYAHCPSQAWQPIDRLKQILLIIEYLMVIIKSLMEVLTPHFHFSSPYSGDLSWTHWSSRTAQWRIAQLIAIKLDIEFMLKVLLTLSPANICSMCSTAGEQTSPREIWSEYESKGSHSGRGQQCEDMNMTVFLSILS